MGGAETSSVVGWRGGRTFFKRNIFLCFLQNSDLQYHTFYRVINYIILHLTALPYLDVTSYLYIALIQENN